MARIKGIAVGAFISYLRKELGPDVVEEIVAAIGPEFRDRFDLAHPSLGFLAASWYEAPMVHALMDAMYERLSPRDADRLLRTGAQVALKSTLTGTHRAILRVVGSPSLHARFAQRLWRTYYDHGRVVSEVAAPDRQVISYYEWEAHHPMLCRFTTESDLVIFPAMGVKNVSVSQLACVSNGDEGCTHEVCWTL